MKLSKSIITILFSVVFIVLTSCGGDKKNNNESTHTHENGSVNQNHAVEEVSKSEMMNLLLRTKQICIELAYYNALAKEISRQQVGLNKALDSGEISISNNLIIRRKRI